MPKPLQNLQIKVQYSKNHKILSVITLYFHCKSMEDLVCFAFECKICFFFLKEKGDQIQIAHLLILHIRADPYGIFGADADTRDKKIPISSILANGLHTVYDIG